MQNRSFEESVQKICETDTRYDPDAYFFLREALDFVTKRIKENDSKQTRHVSAKELLDGIKDYALQEFGPLTLTVLRTWGVQQTEDIGNLVFNLVEAGKLGKTEEDKIEDFTGGYDFTEAFGKPFEPTGDWSAPKTTTRRRKPIPPTSS